MSIQSEIDRLKEDVKESYEMVKALGTAEIEISTQDADHLPSAIASLSWATASTIITIKVPVNADIGLSIHKQFNTDTDPYGTLWRFDIDWGDGATGYINNTTSQSQSHYTINHIYSTAGIYSIKVTPNQYITSYKFQRQGTNHNYILGYGNQGYLKSTMFGEKCNTISSDTFANCVSVGSIVIPNSVEYVSDPIIHNGQNLMHIRLPSNSTYTMCGLNIQSCPKLEQLVIPATITSFYSKPFSSCPNMKELHLKSTTPPTLMNENWYEPSWLPTTCKIYVPTGSLSAYQNYLYNGKKYPNPSVYTYVEE